MDSLTQNASDVSLLTSLEENEIAKKENELTLDIHEPLLKDKFEYIASKKADDIAVYANDANLTFDELNAKANVFANSLKSSASVGSIICAFEIHYALLTLKNCLIYLHNLGKFQQINFYHYNFELFSQYFQKMD